MRLSRPLLPFVALLGLVGAATAQTAPQPLKLNLGGGLNDRSGAPAHTLFQQLQDSYNALLTTRGQANGFASLDASGRIPPVQLPPITLTLPNGGQIGTLQITGTDSTGNVSTMSAKPKQGLIARSFADHANDTLSVLDAGAFCDGKTHPISAQFSTLAAAQALYPTAQALTDQYDQVAFEAIIGLVNTGQAATGKVINVPVGTCMLNRTLSFATTEPDGVASITLAGQGQHNTTLNFTLAPAGSDGISIFKRTGITVRGLKVQSAPRDAISVIEAKHIELADLRLQSSGRDGLRVTDAYMIGMRQIWSLLNASNGFTFGIIGGSGLAAGYNTSLSGNTLYASQNGLDGFVFNNMTYSSFNGTGSDLNRYGYTFANIGGIAMNGAGAESNRAEGFYAVSSQSILAGATVPDIRGLNLNGAVAVNNSTAFATGNNFGLFASFDNRPLNVTLTGCVDLAPPTTISKSMTVTNATAHVVDINGIWLLPTNYNSGAIAKTIP